MHTLVQANCDALAQATELLEGLGDVFYRQKNIGSASGIGAHIRHIVDHYRALQSGLLSGLVDYDSRRRDCPAENVRRIAIAELNQLRQWLVEELDATNVDGVVQHPDRPIVISSAVCFNSSRSMNIPSTPRRELCYLLNHTVHHVAYISLLIKQAGFNVADSVGVAPATLSSRQPALQRSNS